MGLYDRINFFDDATIDDATIASQLAALPAYTPQATSSPERRSALGEIWSQLKAGAFVDLPRMAGRAMQYVSTPGNSLYDTGKGLVEDADAIASLPEMKQGDTTDRPIVNALSQGARMIPQSIAPAVGAGLVLSGVGAPAGVALIGGSALGALPAGLAQAQETYEKGLAKHDISAEHAASMPDDPRVQETLNASRMTGGIEWGGETAAGVIGGKLLGIGGKISRPLFGKFLAPVEQQAAAQILKNFSIPTMAANYGKQVFKTAAGETATEMAQSAAEAGVEHHYGYDQQTPWDAAQSAVLPSLGMTALLAPFGIPAHVAHSRGMVQAADALSNPQAPRELRSAAAEQVYSELARVSPEAASNFAARSFDAIHGHEETGSAPYGLNLDEDSIQPFTPEVFHQPEQEQNQTAAPVQPVSDGPLGKALASSGVGMQQETLGALQQQQDVVARPLTPNPQDLSATPFDISDLNPGRDSSAPMYSLKNIDNSDILTADTTGGAHHERTDEGRTAGVHQGATTVAADGQSPGGTTLERIAGHTPDQLTEQIESTPIIGERFTRPIKQALVEHYHNPALWFEMARRQPELAPDFKAVAATLDSPAKPLTVAAKVAANLTADAIRIKFDPTFEQQAAQHDPQAVQDLAGRWYAERGDQSPFFRLWSHNAPVISLDDAIPANSLATGKPVVVKGWHTSPGTINRYHSEFAGAHSGFETKGWIWMAPHEGAVDHLDGVDGMHGNQYATEQFYQRMLNPKRLLMTGKAMTRETMEKAQQQGHDGVLLVAKGKLVNSVVFEPRNFKAVENRGTFNTTEYSRYSLQEGLQEQDNTQTPPHQQNPATETASQQSVPVFSLTIDQVAKAFPNQQIKEGAEGFTISLKNGSTIRVNGTDEIQFNSKAAEASYGRTPTANEVPVAMFQRMGRDAVISLTEAGTGEIHHETFHAAMALALNEKQRATLLDKFGTEEAAAQEYQRLKDSGSFEQKKGHLWLQAIYQFFQRIRNLFSPTSQIMEQIATGKAWEQQPSTANESPRYSLKEISNKLTQVKATVERLNKTADKSAFVKDDLKPALKTAKEGLAASWDGLKAATAPMQRSEAAEEAGRILIEGMGTRERYKEQFISNLNKAVDQAEKATSSTAKLLDLMQHSTTLADKLFNTMPEAKRIDFMQRMDTGQQQANPELQRLADTIKAMFEEKAAKVQSLGTGALEQTRENYFPHIWKRGEDAKKEIISRLSKRPLEGGKGFTKGRVFDDVLAGIEAKHELVSTNPIDLVFLKLAEMDKYINAHIALQAMEASELVQLIPAAEKMPDGFTDIAGKYGMVTKKGFMNPESGTEEVSSYRYVAREDVAQVFNNYLSQGLYTNKYVGAPFRGYMQAANMLNQFQLGVGSAFHAGFTSLEAVISHGALGIKALARGDFKEATKYLKQAPAAWYLNPKLGDTVLKAWMGDAAAAKEMPQVVEWLQMAGARRLMDSRFQTNTTQELLQKWADGNKGGAAIRALPALVEQSARPILEWLVPRQKFGVFAEMAHSWSKQNPNASHDQTRKAMQQIWNRVDSRLGQVVYDRLFVHSIAKNLTQAIIRAPGWTGGTILEVGGGIKDLTSYMKGLVTGKKPELTDRAAYTLSMLVTTAVANALLTALFTGEPPDDWKDLVAFKTGKKDEKGNPERFMLPTYMKDVYAYVQQPGTTLLHKTHPMLSLISDTIKNKDYYGTEIRHSGDNPAWQLLQVAGFTAKAFVPFWMKGVAKEQERGGSAAAMLAPLIGIMPAPASMNMTKAEKLASELVQGRMPQGTKTKEQFEKGQLIAHLTSLARRDPRQAIQEINEAVQQRKISNIQARHIAQNARIAPVQVAFKRLSLEEAQRVWEAATPEEKRLLYPLMIRKKQNRQG